MRIPELASIAGVSVRTVRHYHNIGLLPLPERRGAWRDYSIQDLERLLYIRTLAEAGVPLQDIRPSGNYQQTCAEAIKRIDTQLAKLQRHRTRLEALQEHTNDSGDSLLPSNVETLFDQAEELLRAQHCEQALPYLHRKRQLDQLGIRLGFSIRNIIRISTMFPTPISWRFIPTLLHSAARIGRNNNAPNSSISPSKSSAETARCRNPSSLSYAA